MNTNVKEYEIIAKSIADKKGWNIVILDMSETTILADCFVICSARNVRQAQSIADAVEEALKKEGRAVRHREGYTGGRWILLDTGDTVVHIFMEQERDYYGLENVWSDTERIPFEGA
ncbi:MULTISPECIES: ribosome silencing factor [Megasphaera]|uniref:Ribosomal silencing factor RsfS n=1 Tax=Megasphaera vaginalis (ex Srinivasan et al. 2021) TaxID=1111454 RepID=U7UGE3_9FIRM|nr:MULTISPECIES: ribosome silencing factor [Megasphaera]ERT58381.1 ribosome silencing factor [Megasphaera vaginalis (ex Srinivasan et al. 2021)]